MTKLTRLHSIWNVVDASCFLEDLKSVDNLNQRKLHINENDERTVAEVLVDQV